MKRFVYIALALMLTLAGAGLTEENLHLLWGIEFGQDLHVVQEILKDKFGLEMKYSEGTVPLDDGTIYEFSGLTLDEGVAMTMGGYPVMKFTWMQSTLSERAFILFDSVNHDAAGPDPAFFVDVMTALTAQYGAIDTAVLDVYSPGWDAWKDRSRSGVHEVRHLRDLEVSALNMQSLLNGLDYDTENAEATLYITLGNIQVIFSRVMKDGYDMMEIRFGDKVEPDSFTDIREEYRRSE